MAMAKEWLEWVRSTIGYKDSSLTMAHYDKLCRNQAKDIFTYLQKHIKTNDEVRTIKENIEIFGMEDVPEKEKVPKTSKLQAAQEEWAQTRLEIQLAEERIKKHEIGMAKKARSRTGRSNDLIDMQRRNTLLRGVIKDEMKDTDDMDGCVRDMESFLTTCIAKCDDRPNTQDLVDCAGCKKANASILLEHLCSLVDESENTSVVDQSNAVAVAGARELVIEHTADCLMKAFLACNEAGEPKEDVVTRHPSSIIEQDYVQALQLSYIELLEETAALVKERKETERILDDKLCAILDSSSGIAVAWTEHFGCELSEWVEHELTVAGCDSKVKWLSQLQRQQLPQMTDMWNKGKSDLEAASDEIRQLLEQLESLESKIDDAFAKLGGVSNELVECKSQTEQVLQDYIAICKAALTLHRRLLMSRPDQEKCISLLNAVKAADIFESFYLSDGTKLSDLFVQNSKNYSNVAAGRETLCPMTDVLRNIWEQIESEDGLRKISTTLSGIQDKDASIRTGAIAELMSKLATCERPVSELQTCFQRLRDGFTEWSLVEAEGVL